MAPTIPYNFPRLPTQNLEYEHFHKLKIYRLCLCIYSKRQHNL